MKLLTIVKILLEHGKQIHIKDETIFTLNEWTKDGKYECEWIDVTDYTPLKLYEWLGY